MRGDRTVVFLPHRLNRQPVIVRGLTANELWISVGASAAVGLLIGLPLATAVGSIALAPTMVMVSIAAGIFFGGTLLRRRKRGRPDTWLYRHVQWWARQHAPAVCSILGGQDLIVRSGRWAIRRTGAARSHLTLRACSALSRQRLHS